MQNRQKLLRPKSLRHFQLRGGQGHRLESMSDSVFGLAIAILLLASSVPKNFTELLHFVCDALPLFICMIFIYHIWHQQAVFFLRYGLYDNITIRLNLMLLFLVLFYAYPLMVIYGAGFLGIFFVFYLLYKHAYKHRELLELNEIEIVQTQFDIQDVGIVILVAALSILIALIGVLAHFSFASFFAGLVYNLLWIIFIPISKRQEKKLQLLLAEKEG